MTKIKPTIGRVVWYKPNPSGLDINFQIGDQMQSAIIAYVWSDELVNLSVNDADGQSYGKTSVPLHQGEPNDCPLGSCCWMPYQKAQAAKE